MALKFTKEDEERLRELIRTVIREELSISVDTRTEENYFTSRGITITLRLDGEKISEGSDGI